MGVQKQVVLITKIVRIKVRLIVQGYNQQELLISRKPHV